MEARLISLPLAPLAGLLDLVGRVEPVELKDSGDWALLIRVPGFTRLRSRRVPQRPLVRVYCRREDQH